MTVRVTSIRVQRQVIVPGPLILIYTRTVFLRHKRSTPPILSSAHHLQSFNSFTRSSNFRCSNAIILRHQISRHEASLSLRPLTKLWLKYFLMRFLSRSLDLVSSHTTSQFLAKQTDVASRMFRILERVSAS